MTRLTESRRFLLDYFCERADERSIRIYPRTDIQQLDLLERLYEERTSERGFIIELGSSEAAYELDFFLKSMEIEDVQIDIMYVVASRPDVLLEELWSMYSTWMHENYSISDIQRRFKLKKRTRRLR